MPSAFWGNFRLGNFVTIAMTSFRGQMKQVFRRLRRSPMFTFVAIMTLAVGIGANTAIFSVLDGVLLKPLPYPDPDRLVGLWCTAPGVNIQDLNISPSQFFTYREENHTFENLGVYDGDRVTITGLAEPEQVDSLLVTAGLLPTLGVQPFIGRTFSASDDTPGTPETLILSYGYWQRRFAGDRSILGRRLMIDGKAKEVIGIMPASFRFLDMDAALLQPFRFDRNRTKLGNFSQRGVARLKPGVTLAQANADGARMQPIVSRKFQPPAGFSAKLFEQARITPTFRPFKDDLTGDTGPMLWVLMGTIGIVLLIACANVANLLLVRVEARHTELAVRAALGATSRQIAYELLFESLTVALLGGCAGLALAFGALRLLVAIAPAGIPRITQIGINGPVLLFALLVSLFTGLLFGSLPVLKYAGTRLNASMREGGRTLSQSRERHRASSLLVVVQVALALVLLISSGLMIRTFLAMTQVQPGFTHPEQIQSFSIFVPEGQIAEPIKVLALEDDLAASIRSIPGVSSVAMTTAIPMGFNSSTDLMFARDRTYAEGQIPPLRRFVHVSPGLNQTLGNPFIGGRDFTPSEVQNHAPLVLISENFAREYWGSVAAALHKQVRESATDDWREIIGVVGDIHMDGLDKPAPTVVYYPLLATNFEGNKVDVERGVTYVVHSSRAGSESLLNEIRKRVWSINPNLPLARVRTLNDLYRKSMARTSFTLVLLIIAAAMALLLGAIGIYGVIAYSVSQRTREIGIRMALGAARGEVTVMFVRRGLSLAGVGAAFGLVSAFVVTRLLSTLLFNVSPADPLTYGSMLVVLLVIAVLASYLPSRRAAAIDPSLALRMD